LAELVAGKSHDQEKDGQKNRSCYTWSILLSKLSSALFYTLFGVMGTDSVLDCGMTYRLAVAHTF
jgi:hypothetical protein